VTIDNNTVLAAIAAAAVAGTAWRVRALTLSGAVAAAMIGAACALAGPAWIAVLIIFFVTSTALSRFRESAKTAITQGINAKGSERDAVQVVANGGIFGLMAFGSSLAPSPYWMTLGAASLAASAADTWATEIGTLSRARPRSIVTAREVPPGTSGGITVAGLMATVAGAASIAGAAAAVGWTSATVQAAFFGGIVGSLVDSLLGATLQSKRWCGTCGMETERSIHSCGAPTTSARGLSWMDNDVVNLMCSTAGAAFGVFWIV
jgi:uncharacterized protein (TIGR00297 family)